jgi:signal transduction histidine kinase/CheY-like chemotaxis protein
VTLPLPEDTPPARQAPRRGIGTTQFLRALFIAIIIVAIARIGTTGWLTYNAVFQEGHEEVRRASDAIEQQAQKTFQASELIVDQIAERTAGMSWEEIPQSADLHALLRRLGEVPGNSVTGLIAPDRTIVATNRDFPMPPIKARVRSYLEVPRAGHPPIYVSDVSVGNYSGRTQFFISEYKPNSEQNNSGGMVFVSLPLSSFIDYYRSIIDSDQYVVNMARSDGAVLLRFPDEALIGRVLSPQSQFRQTIAQNPERGSYDTVSELDGIPRLFAYRKIGGYPVYITVGLSREALFNKWGRQMGGNLLFGIPAFLTLMLLTLVGLRRSIAADRALVVAEEETRRRAEAEESLRQSQKMEAVGQLTGGVAHDFNNLLTVVTGSLDLVLQHPDDAAKVRNWADMALRAAERGQRLTSQLLTFARRQVTHPEIVNPNRLISEILGLLMRAVGSGVRIATELDPVLDPANIDPAQFETALLNLAINARDAMNGTGSLTIATENVELDAGSLPSAPELAPGRYIRIAVRDTGSGMPPEIATRIFEPFFTTKEAGRGSGLGLSQVYGFVTAAGGHVTVASIVGAGTTMTLYLPRSAEPPRASERPPEFAPLRRARNNERILVVEDDSAVLEIAVQNLAELDYGILTAGDALVALEILRGDDRIDLLFADVVMPGGMNGVQLAVEARRLRPGLKVLLTSGYTAAALGDVQRLDGDVDLLAKPYRQDELARRLRLIMG